MVALDFLPLMIARTQAQALQAGVADRLEVLEQDMHDMAFPPASFDVIWSEGAIYNLGFRNGLQKVQPFVKPGGYVAVSEVVWLRPDPPAPVIAFWEEYPEIAAIDDKLAVIASLGYEAVDHFVLPETAWTAEYYDPMEALIDQKADEWAELPEAMAVIEAARDEIAFFRRYSRYFGYAFFVMRLPVGAAAR